MKKIFKKISYFSTVSALSLVALEPSFAQGIDRITAPVKTQLPGITDLLSAVAYVAGIGFGIKAALKLKEHNESKGQVPLSAPITLFLVAGILLALPTLPSIATETVFGAGNTKNTLDGQSTRVIN